LFFSVLSVALFQSNSIKSFISVDYLKDLLAGKIVSSKNTASLFPVADALQVPLPVASSSEPVAAVAPKSVESLVTIPPAKPESIIQEVELKNEKIEVYQAPTSLVKQDKSALPLKEITSAEIPIPDLQIGQAWVKKMPRGTFLVQHVALPTIQDALIWIQKHPNLKNSRVVATYLPNQKSTQYSIVSGPFPSLIEATTFAESPGIPRDPMIRSARFMKEQFSPEQADADAKKRKENKR
jgi:septal ring-binding cell division protein DamX